jgi:flagellar protein FliO/FliZ
MENLGMSWLFWLFVLVLLAAASGSAYMAYRTYVAGDTGPNLKGWLFKPRPEPRLGVVEQATIDSRRRLVLIRRDEVEHLIMTGGPVDVVIEEGIKPPISESAARAPTEPLPPVFARQARSFGQAVNE